MHFTFLGTGTSHGIPMIGCRCEVCTSSDAKNKRMRCSLYAVAAGQHLLFDTPPDFREQAIRFDVERVDAVFLTHAHADHIFGFDDVRRFSTLQEQHIPVYGSPETIRLMQVKFDYVGKSSYGFESVPRVDFIEQTEAVDVGNARITPLPVRHGRDTIYGFRIDGDGCGMAYVPDCSDIPDETLRLLENLDTMILDGLRPKPHPTHYSIDEAVAMLSRIGAVRSYITHLTHNSEHHALQARLEDTVTVPWDGMKVELGKEL